MPTVDQGKLFHRVWSWSYLQYIGKKATFPISWSTISQRCTLLIHCLWKGRGNHSYSPNKNMFVLNSLQSALRFKSLPQITTFPLKLIVLSKLLVKYKCKHNSYTSQFHTNDNQSTDPYYANQQCHHKVTTLHLKNNNQVRQHSQSKSCNTEQFIKKPHWLSRAKHHITQIQLHQTSKSKKTSTVFFLLNFCSIW